MVTKKIQKKKAKPKKHRVFRGFCTNHNIFQDLMSVTQAQWSHATGNKKRQNITRPNNSKKLKVSRIRKHPQPHPPAVRVHRPTNKSVQLQKKIDDFESKFSLANEERTAPLTYAQAPHNLNLNRSLV